MLGIDVLICTDPPVNGPAAVPVETPDANIRLLPRIFVPADLAL